MRSLNFLKKQGTSAATACYSERRKIDKDTRFSGQLVLHIHRFQTYHISETKFIFLWVCIEHR